MHLAIDACGRSPSIAIASADGRIIRCASLPLGRGKADQLPQLLECLQSGLEDGFELLAVTTGPGSYTGIRACLSMIKGLALAWRLPVFGLSAFEVLGRARAASPSDIVLIDAGRGRVWGRPALDECAEIWPLDHWKENWPQHAMAIGSDEILMQLPVEMSVKKGGIELNAIILHAALMQCLNEGRQPSSGFDILPLYLSDAGARLSAGRSLLPEPGRL